MANKNLNNAKRAKKDEFYTRREDIERELTHYEEHFRGKTVYCNCDDPETSEFWRFFVRNFWPYGLKKLMATHYEPDEQNFSYKLELTEMKSGQLSYDATKTPIQSNGDFRSAACIELLKEADIVVTNPPFSLFREYVAQLVEYGKKFIIIGNQNALTYKEIFPLIKNNKMWLGYGFPGNVGFFHAPGYEDYAVSSQHKEGMIRVSGVIWFTNLDIPKRHQFMDLRGNHYSPEKYPKYVNYDAIEVSRVDDIPEDYDGEMGVPITFMTRYNPAQFEIIGSSRWLGRSMSEIAPKGSYVAGGIRFYLPLDKATEAADNLSHSTAQHI
ncbi:MAG: hypothetical protein IJK52_01180, partial [Oscillospiraceae bacterium]|nr:hypothetical protein [Oscillospiraceae bacterium]